MSTTFTDEQFAAALAVAHLDHHLWFDIATSLSCLEIEVIVNLLRVFGFEEDTLQNILASHADGDDEGDSHYHLKEQA